MEAKCQKEISSHGTPIRILPEKNVEDLHLYQQKNNLH